MARGWSTHDGLAVAIPKEGIDTDQLIPARFMSAPRSEGYGGFLLHDMRSADPAFPLDAPDAGGASILVARRNFGGGSSREAAVYALVDYGIKAVIAPSFGDIFSSNAVNNGLLPARVSEADAEALIAALDTPARLSIDLAAGNIRGAGLVCTFALDPVWRTKLRNGWDDIDLTVDLGDDIRRFRDEHRKHNSWVFLPEVGS